MHRIVTEIGIRASPADIWAILSDFSSYPVWNPFIRSIEGEPAEGSRLEVCIRPPDGKSMRFRPRVLTCVENQELRWRGRVLMPGLFDGEHYFQIGTTEPGRSRFVHGEDFSGLLVPFLRSSLDTRTRAGFITMNQALKSHAEHA